MSSQMEEPVILRYGFTQIGDGAEIVVRAWFFLNDPRGGINEK